jgi:hypothetical protein
MLNSALLGNADRNVDRPRSVIRCSATTVYLTARAARRSACSVRGLYADVYRNTVSGAIPANTRP